MDEKQYIDDKEGLILNHLYEYTYKNQRFEITLKDVFDRMVCEMNESVEYYLFKKKNYQVRLRLEVIPQKVKK